MTAHDAIERLREIDRELQLLEHASALLSWDEETYMPPRAIEERSEQVALLQGIIHERLASPSVAELLARAGASPERPSGDPALSESEGAFARAFFRKHGREARLPADLVIELSKAATLGQAAWRGARKRSDFSSFAPHLRKLVALTRRKTECLGYAEEPYDALIDEYEPWMKTSEVRSIFSSLEPRLARFVAEIGAARQVDDGFLRLSYPTDLQVRFASALLSGMGFDGERGRLDVSAHPFTTTLGRDDVRITARYDAGYLKTGIFSVIHECGHALYEQGFSEEIRGSLLASGTSLGIHESQSRLWENVIGRSRPFWSHYLPELAKLFPAQLSGVALDSFYRAINRVEPSLIRIEADEVTYGLHIILRFKLETALVSGDLAVDDLPDAWNREMGELLGVKPDNDAEGVLQDVHWSFGAIGYFPTYALGNLYGAQLFAAMRRELPGMDGEIARGNLAPILAWLRARVHASGATLTAGELCEKVTGETLNPDYFLRYLEEKYRPIYDL